MDLTSKLRQEYAPGVPYHVDSEEQRITDFLVGAAERYPNRVALDFMSQQTTYRDLMQQVRQAALVLLEVGIRPGDRVALIMPNCPQHVVAVFATTLIGAVAVEHNPLAPREELRHEFERHQAKVVISWENSVEKLDFLDRETPVFGVNLADALPAASRALLRIPLPAIRAKKALLGAKTPGHVRSWDRAVRNAQAWQGDSTVSPDDVAVLMHTGGTTGVPKAVELTHRNLASNVTQSIAWVPPLHEGSEVFYAILPFFHAYGFTVTLLSGIHLGATIAVFPKFDVSQVMLAQKRLPCTFLVGVPPIFDRLLSETKSYGVDFTSVRFALSGAMPLSEELAKRWESTTGSLMIEGYGMTEGSPVLLGSPLSDRRRPGALGLPYPSTEIRIVDPEDPTQDVGEGEVGELIVRGPQVFRGYLDEPEETREALRDGWLHTGDLVQIRDGYIYMEDRRKELIISGGFNIYPSQVEDVVRAMPGIHDVAVVGLPSGNKGEEVIAALVLEAGASVTLPDVREWAEKSLAHYALPRQIVVLQELPRSQLGKVMRRSVRNQILGLQEEFEERFPTLAVQMSDLADKAGDAAAAVRDSISTAALEAGEAAADLLRRTPAPDPAPAPEQADRSSRSDQSGGAQAGTAEEGGGPGNRASR